MDINKKIRIFKKSSISITYKQIFIAVTVLMTFIMLLSVVQVIASFLFVGEIKIVGIHPYDRVDIIQTTQIRSNDFLYAIDTDEVEQRLLAERKYLSSAKVTREFPNKIVIKLESRAARWYIDLSGRKYALDGDLRVIEEIKNTEGVTELVLPDVKKVISGDVPRFGQSDITVTECLKIIDEIRSSSLRSRLTKLDVSDRTNIRIVIDGKYEGYLGNSEALSGKIATIERLLENEEVKNAESGSFHAESYPSTEYVSFVPN